MSLESIYTIVKVERMSERYLITNSYPFSLVRREVHVRPVDMEWVKGKLNNSYFGSAWGHANTINTINQMLGVDVTPTEERPAIVLSEEGFPMLNGETFHSVIVISPDFVEGYRPDLREEITEDVIIGWHALLLEFDLIESNKETEPSQEES